jgi:hypothetical protein
MPSEFQRIEGACRMTGTTQGANGEPFSANTDGELHDWLV